jgi:hypothetical protein
VLKSKASRTGLLIVAIFAVASFVLFWKSPRHAPASPEPTLPLASAAVEEDELPLPESDVIPVPAPVAAATTDMRLVAVPLSGSENLDTPEGPIDQVLLSEQLTEAEKAKRLLEMLPTLPENLQAEAAQHMCNLMPDEAYGQLGPLLTNGIAPEHIMDAVMPDLLSRPNVLKLPILLLMARNDQHPRHEESHALLEVYLEKDLGSDWPAWEKSLQAYLKANPQ